MRTTLTLRNSSAGHLGTKIWTVHVAVEGDQSPRPQTLCNVQGQLQNLPSTQGRRVECKRCMKKYERLTGVPLGISWTLKFDKAAQ